jgi:hypothetical protein
MYEQAKASREAMKAKAKRLASASSGKIDASSYKTPDDMKAGVKTGMRPVSRRAFKSGGKVTGEESAQRADRAPRTKSKDSPAEYAKAKINRDVKAANEEREGQKHVGGMKSGGRAKRADGGKIGPNDRWDESKEKWVKVKPRPQPKEEVGPLRPSDHDNPDKFRPGEMNKGGRAKRNEGGRMSASAANSTTTQKYRAALERAQSGRKPAPTENRVGEPGSEPVGYDAEGMKAVERGHNKHGGRTKKMAGGPVDRTKSDIVKSKAMEFGQNTVTPGLKKGGKVSHPDEAADKALIRKMVKPSARKAKATGGANCSCDPPEPAKAESMMAEPASGARVGDRARQSRQAADVAKVSAATKSGAIAAMRKDDPALKSMAGDHPEAYEAMTRPKAGANLFAGSRYDDGLKKGGRVGKKIGGATLLGGLGAGLAAGEIGVDDDEKGAAKKKGGRVGKFYGGSIGKAEGGGTTKAKTKGPTNINIVIAAGGKQPDGMPAGGPPPDAPSGIPIPVGAGGPPPGPGMPMAGGAPGMPMPMGGMPGGGPGALPPGLGALMGGPGDDQNAMPMPRKSGGRVKGYMKSKAGGGSGLGRLQKAGLA